MCKFIRQQFYPTAIAMLLLTPATDAATGSNPQLSGAVRAGAAYHSNVNNSQLEQASGRGDSARVLEAEIKTRWAATNQWQLEGGYSFSDTAYRQADSYSSQLHLLYADSSYRFGAHTAGVNLYYANARLDDADFLTLRQASLYSMHMLQNQLVLRPALTIGEKHFTQFSARNSTSLNAAVDSFWFYDGSGRFISVGLLAEQERSDDVQYRYKAAGIRLKWSGQYQFWHDKQQFQLALRYNRRDYEHSSSALPVNTDAERQDNQLQLEAVWQWHLNDYFALHTKLEHGDFDSTLQTANYRDSRASVLLALSF